MPLVTVQPTTAATGLTHELDQRNEPHQQNQTRATMASSDNNDQEEDDHEMLPPPPPTSDSDDEHERENINNQRNKDGEDDDLADYAIRGYNDYEDENNNDQVDHQQPNQREAQPEEEDDDEDEEEDDDDEEEEEEDDDEEGDAQQPHPRPSLLNHLHTDKFRPIVPGVIDSSLVDYQRSQAYTRATPLPPSTQASVHLLHLLQEAGAPLSMFGKFWEWHKQVQGQYQVPHNFTPPSRESVVNQISTHYSINNLKPRVVDVFLPGSKVHIKLSISSFRHQLYSLLNDPRLQTDDCFLFNGETPFDQPTTEWDPIPDDHVYQDINSGQRYFQCWTKLCLGKDKHVLCPIIFYVDATYTDSKGKLTLEPVSFTLGIYNYHTRNQPYAWRTIAFIPKNYSKRKLSSEEVITDYHVVLSYILDEFVKCQQSGGIRWTIPFKGKMHDVILQIPVLYIIGDTQGHDKMCARTNKKEVRICRACDCAPKDADDPEYEFEYTVQQDAIDAFERQDTATMESMGLFNIRNVWWNVDFGGCERGIYGAVPGEILHFLQQGLHKYLKDGLLSQKLTTDVARKKQKVQKAPPKTKKKRARTGATPRADSNAEEDVVWEPIDQEDQSRLNVFNNKIISIVEDYAEIIGTLLQRQSERNLTRTKFTQGITKNQSMIKACEEQGVLLLLLLFLSSTAGSTVLTDPKDEHKFLGKARMSTFIGTFEHMILFEEFMKSTKLLPERTLRLIEDFIPPLMTRFKNTIDRQEGNQMKIIKFHLMLHVVDDIRRFGLPPNFSTGPSESRHKSHCKEPGRHTQRRAETFISQVQRRFNEQLAIETAVNDPMYMNYKRLQPQPQTGVGDTQRAPAEPTDGHLHCKVFSADASGWKVKFGNRSKSVLPRDNISGSYKQVLDYIVGKLIPALGDEEEHTAIEIYSEYKTTDSNGNATIYRSTPSYRSNKPWTDWAYVEIEDEDGEASPVDRNEEYDADELDHDAPTDQRFDHDYMQTTRPTELFGFFCLPPITQDITLHGGCVLRKNNRPREYMIGIPLKMNPIAVGGVQHKSSTIQYWSRKSSEPVICPSSKILHPCLVIPDYNVNLKSSNELCKTESYTVLGPPDDWSDCFLFLANDYHHKVVSNRPDYTERSIDTG